MEKVEDPRIVVDTDIVIEFFRVKEKDRSILKRLLRRNKSCSTSAVTLFEFAYGAHLGQLEESSWELVFQGVEIIPVDESIARRAAKVASHLRLANLDIGFRDSIIAATCMQHNLQLATKNTRHFSRLKGLKLLNLSTL